MELSESERKLIEKIRSDLRDNHHEEHVFMVRYIPTDYEGSFIQQVLVGEPQSVLQMRLAMKKLLDDLVEQGFSSSFFTIVHDPFGVRLFQH